MESNALSRVLRHDGSYFYILELGFQQGLYKYILVNWLGKHLGEPKIIYSHTKRMSLSLTDKEYFDNNLLSQKRLDRYFKQGNLYIGGIDRINNQPIREYKEGIVKQKKHATYLRDDNYILIELIQDGEIKSYYINEFVNRNGVVDYESNVIYSEKDLLDMQDEKDYVVNELLKKERVEKKVKDENGYVGTVIEVNGKYKKVSNEESLVKVKRISIN